MYINGVNLEKIMSEITPEIAIGGFKRAGLRQPELAERLDCSQSTISRVSRGEQMPSYQLMDKMRVLYKELCAEERVCSR